MVGGYSFSRESRDVSDYFSCPYNYVERYPRTLRPKKSIFNVSLMGAGAVVGGYSFSRESRDVSDWTRGLSVDQLIAYTQA